MKLDFEQIIAEHYNVLYLYGQKLVQDEELIKDELQELFLEMWQNQRLNEVTYIRTYLLRSFRRRLFYKNKSAHHQTDNFPILSEPSIEDKIIANEMATEQNEKVSKLKLAIKKLNKTQQEIIFLRYYNDLNYSDIADILNIQYQSVRNAMHRAMKKLRRMEN